MQKIAPTQTRAIRLPAVKNITGLGRTSVLNKCDPTHRHYDPTFPKPMKLGARAIAWPEAEVIAWVESVFAGRAQCQPQQPTAITAKVG